MRLSKSDLRIFISTFSLLLIAFFKGYSQISGNVFNDNNSNGIRNSLRPNERAIVGATVQAFVGQSTTPIVKTTDASGNYSFSAGEIPAGTKVRIEFIANGLYLNSGLTGSSSQSSVQFATAPKTNVSFGVLTTQDYCQFRPPYFAVPCYVTGDPLISTGDVTKDAGEGDALVAFDYMAEGLSSATNFPPVHLGLAKDIGAVWGVGFHARTNHVISAAVIKRHAGLGSLGTGGLYKTNIATGAVSPYLDVKTIGIDTGPDPHVGLPADKNLQSKDSLTFSKVGKVGIGGTDFSIDNRFYYMSNLYDKKVYRIAVGKDLSTPTAAGVRSYTLPNGGCSNGDYSTWAVTCDGPDVYVGVNCTAETSQLLSDLKVVVYKLDTAAGTFTEMISFPLGFKRGSADRTGRCVENDTWYPWTNKFPAPCDGRFVMYPQPILSDVYFDNNGHMLLGFMDRFGHQAGAEMPDLSGNGDYKAFMGGDLMRAYRNPDNSFSLENNGTAGPLVGSGVGNGQGIGGGEFFADDQWKFFGKVAHDEVLNGGLLVVPGYDEVLSTSFDPIDEIFMSSGWQVYDVTNGKALREFAVFGETDTSRPYERKGTFGKAAALGSGRAMCDPAPIEVGNRIWIDTDIDGVQDPDELGIDGVEVLICDATTNQIVGKDTTSDGGRYFFNNGNVITNATNKGLEFEKNYVIKIVKSQPALAMFQRITSKDSGASDLIDSDGQEDATNMFVAFRSGDIGETNHTFDFGLIECLKLDSLVISKCDLWTNTYTAKVYVGYNNTPAKNIHLVLKKPDGTLVKDTVFVPTTTSNHQLITIADLNSNGLVGMKFTINVVGSEADTKCFIDTTYTAPEQCTTPPPGKFLDPMGFIYCEETGEIIKGATVEITGPKPAIILEDGRNGEYRFVISPGAFGVYTLKINLPAGYSPSTKCLVSPDVLQLSGKPNPFLIGNPPNADTTFMSSSECTVFYKSFNIQFGDPITKYNNIPLSGCCVKPNAGKDSLICLLKTTSLDLVDAKSGETWVALDPTVGPTINASTGLVSNLTISGTFKFILQNTLSGLACRDTVTISVAPNPTATTTATPTTCAMGEMQSNGKLEIVDFDPTERYVFSIGSTYSGSVVTHAAAAPIPVTGVIAANLPNPKGISEAYTIRVFNFADCYKDYTVLLQQSTQDCCIKPLAGKDSTVCLPTNTIDLIDAKSNETWIAFDPAAGPTINVSTGLVSGLTAGTYKFILKNTLGATCSDTIAIMVAAKPIATAVAKPTTCVNGIMPPNGQLELASFDSAERFAYSTGGTYSGSVAYDAAAPIPSSGIIVNNLPNPTATSQDYTIRVFNAAGCFKDITVQLMKSSTDNCCIKPLAGKDSTVCLPTNTVDLIDAKSNEMWVAFDPAASPVINASTGLVSNLVTAGTYKFILQNTLGTAACSDTVVITVAPTPVSSAIAKPTTCVNNVMQANGQIELDNFNPGERYAYSLGSFYAGSLTYATATAIPSSRIIADNLPDPTAASQAYTVRIFNAAGCYKDITVQLMKSTASCCVKPLAGNDATICLTSTTTVDLTDAKSDETWVAFDLTGPAINASTGLVSGLTTAGTYKFILKNTLGAASCADTVAIIVAPKPVATAIAKPTTCVNSVMQANGQLELVAFDPAERFGYSTGSTYSGSAVAYDAATPIPSSGIIVNNLPDPTAASQAYTVRIFNAAGCYKDITVQLMKSTASCCIKPIAGIDLTICLASSTTVDLTDAKSDETWVSFDPAVGPTINANTGLVSGLTTAGSYKFILKNTLGAASCADTVAIIVAPKPVATAIAKPTTCVNSVMQANGQLELVAFDPAERYAYSTGSTYSGSAVAYDAATPIPSSGIIVNNLPNPTTASQDYTIRVFNAAGCFKDIMVQLMKSSTASCCTRPDAGKDSTICGLSTTTVDLRNAIGSERWAVVAGNPAAATIDELSGIISNLLVDGTYKFQLMTSQTCSDTVSVTIGMKPTFIATTTKVTCTNGSPISNGMITLSNFTAGYRFAFEKGSVYNGTVLTFANATAIPASGIITASLANPSTASEDYTIRVFNTAGCYSDLTVKLEKEAACCVPICVPFMIIKRTK